MNIKDLCRRLIFGNKASSSAYIKYLRSIGMQIGMDTTIYVPTKTQIDTTRPWLITIGNNVKITEGVTILTHGFDWSVLKGVYGEIIGSSGGVSIGDNVFIGMHSTILKGVHIGDNTTIGNALFEGMCVVGKDTKIDNHVYIAHNCEIGEHVVITAGVIILGSVTVGNNVWVAPNVLALNKVVISDNAFIGGMSLVTKNVPENTCVVGIPAKNWRRQK